jgi:pimeloyl-ACP methyl ester carboxylesterase
MQEETMTTIYKTPEGQQIVMNLYDDALAQWPVPYETRTLNTRHGETFVLISGDESAPPLVLLHGAGTNSSMWGGDIRAYSQHYRVYSVDLIGEAGRSAPNRPDWNSPAYAEWLADVLDALHIEHAVFVGLSQGAWTILKFAVAHPERVEKMALITPGGIVPDKLSFLLRVIGLSLLGASGRRKLVRSLFGSQPVPDGVEAITATMMQHFKGRMGVLPIFTDTELKRLTMPVLVLGGAQDALRDMDKIAARFRANVPHLDVEIIPGGGHALIQTAGRVLAFLHILDLNSNRHFSVFR